MLYMPRMAKPVAFPVKKLVGLTDEMQSAIEDFRFATRQRSESDAIRRLIELGLDAARKSEEPT